MGCGAQAVFAAGTGSRMPTWIPCSVSSLGPWGCVSGVVIDSKEVGWGGTVVPSGRVLIAGQMAHELE